MNQKKQIESWLQSGTITPGQAQKMLFDVDQNQNEERSSKFIVAISVIGSVLLGIGAILFFATNWERMSDIVKVMVALIATFGSYFLGYMFKYEKQNLPKVGASLIFLGAILFGATIFLVAQIYNINANAHSLVLIWLIGILPLVYAFKSIPIAHLSSLVFFIWVSLFIFKGLEFYNINTSYLPIIYLSAGTFLFSVGGLHYLKPELAKIARIFRLSGIKVAMLSLFILTFDFISGSNSFIYSVSDNIKSINPFISSILFFSILSIIGLVINLFFNPSKSENNTQENGVALGVLAIALIYLYFPQYGNLYTLLFNLIFAGLTIFVIYSGYKRLDIELVNNGILWLTIFLLAKYFDFFYEMMEVSIFFIVGGLILVLGGIAMESKRRQIKNYITKVNEHKYEQ